MTKKKKTEAPAEPPLKMYSVTYVRQVEYTFGPYRIKAVDEQSAEDQARMKAEDDLDEGREGSDYQQFEMDEKVKVHEVAPTRHYVKFPLGDNLDPDEQVERFNALKNIIDLAAKRGSAEERQNAKQLLALMNECGHAHVSEKINGAAD